MLPQWGGRRLFGASAVFQKHKVKKSIQRWQIDHLAKGYKRVIDEIRGPMSKNGFGAVIRIFGLLNSNHVLATTRQSCAKEKVPFSQINISLLADFWCFFLEKNGFSARFPLFGKA